MQISRIKSEVEHQIKPTIKSRAKTIILKCIQRRTFKAYCVGTAKAGTHSIASVFQKNYRAAHEPEGCNLIYLKYLYDKGKITTETLNTVLQRRDIRQNLDMQSSDFAGYFHREFAELDPESKFLLPIRDCYSFLDSIINHQINNPIKPNNAWGLGRDINYKDEAINSPEEEVILREYDGLYSLKGYLNYWAKRNSEVIENIPANRLLPFRTSDITNKIPAIAVFLNVDKTTLSVDKSHAFEAPKKHQVLAKVEPDYIENLVCLSGAKEIMKEFYPEIKHASDVIKQ